MTYWALNAVFLVAVAVVVLLAARRLRWRAVATTLGILLLMTAVFDNIMISIGLVDYDPARISGAFLGIAPLEDFAYAIAAALLLPALWQLLPPNQNRSADRIGGASSPNQNRSADRIRRASSSNQNRSADRIRGALPSRQDSDQ